MAQAQSAFHTAIGRFTQAGRTVLANTAAAQVPSALAGKVTGVLGLSSLGVATGPKAAGLPKLTGYYPDEFPKVYDATSTTPGTGTTLAVIAEGDLTQTIKDLRTYEAKRHLPQVPVTPASTPASRAPTPPAPTSGTWTPRPPPASAPNAKRLYIYVATSLTDSDLARSINSFVAQNVARSGLGLAG